MNGWEPIGSLECPDNFELYWKKTSKLNSQPDENLPEHERYVDPNRYVLTRSTGEPCCPMFSDMAVGKRE